MSPAPNGTLRSHVSRTALFALTLTAIGCHHRPASVAPVTSEDSAATAYAMQTREAIGGAVPTITAAELAKVRAKRVEEMLTGRVAGVRVIPTANGGFTIRIRGTSTLTGNAEPLYVVDGMAVDVAPGEGLNWLDPAQIERIDVLKEAAETSMYGVRGANGVILIKTKGGSR